MMGEILAHLATDGKTAHRIICFLRGGSRRNEASADVRDLVGLNGLICVSIVRFQKYASGIRSHQPGTCSSRR